MKKVKVFGSVVAGILLFGLMAGHEAAAGDKASVEEMTNALSSGGYVIYIRHGRTEKDWADQVGAVMGNCSTQRALSEAGWQDARAIGAAFAYHKIPVAQVVSSEYCRAWQTASLAFGQYQKTSDLNFEPAEEYTKSQFAAMRERTLPYLTSTPPKGFNTVIVGHDDPFEAATGIYPEPMGVAFIVKPDGTGGFAIVGNIPPGDWFK